MIKIFSFLLFPFLLSPSSAYLADAAHDFHVSKCQIAFDEPTSALQITLHLFLDDLEDALKIQGVDKLFLCTEKEDPKAEKYLFRYLQQQLNLMVNEEVVKFEFIGKEQTEDLQAVWIYLEVKNIKTFKSLDVTNSLLMEVFDDQRNIVHIVASDDKQGYLLLHKGQNRDKVIF